MKIKLFLFSIFVLLLLAFISLRVQAADVTAGLIGYWNFDEGAGTIAADSSGTGNTGTISGTPTWIAGNIGNGALQFNGTSNKVLLNTKTIGVGTVTVCAWIKPTQPSYIQSIINNYDFELYTYYSGSSLSIYVSSNHDITSANLGQVTVNSWQHLCVTRQSDGTATLYLNGTQIGSGNSGTPTNVYNSVESIGSRPDGIYYFAGAIDDVRIYNSALSASDVATLAAYTGAGSPSGGPYSVSVSTSGTGSGTVTCSGSSCPSTIASGGSITFTEAPSGGATFSSWGGACSSSGSASTCALSNITGNISVSATFAAAGQPQDTTAPTVPSGLTATAVSSTGINLSWIASTDIGGTGVAGYNIYKCSGAGCTPSTLLTTVTSGTSYSDISLTANTSYSYKISAYDNASPANTSVQTSVVSVLTPNTTTSASSTVSIACLNNSDISSALNAAIAAANDGDSIHILAGTCTLNSLITIQNKKIIISGAGIDQTNISAPAGIAFQTNKIFRITGITFKGNFGGLIIQRIPDYTIPLKGWRVDHIRFEVPNLTQGNGAVFVRGPLNYGVMDHLIFDATLQKNVYVATHLYGFRPDGNETIGGDLEWAQPSALGTDNAVYVEDSVFTIAATNIGFLNDINYGGRMVMRHNTITNGFVQTHAGGHGGRGGTSYEIYDNNFISNTQNYRPGQLRSGTGVIFNNNITGDWDIKSFTIDNVRTSALNGIYGLCDGTQPVDGNTPGEKLPNGNQSGWPCMDQIGRGSGGSLGHQPSDPLYSWNNNNGASSILLIDAWNSTNALQVDHVKTTGDAHPHVGGVLDYVNNGITPKPGYTPYAYPHLATVSGFTADDPNSPPVIPPVIPPADTTAPTVSITAPTTGATISGTVSLSASASDNTGGSGMAGVQFQVDGQNLGVEVVNPPYAGTWDTTSASNGTHVIKAIARDAAGNIATSTAVTVTVNNVVLTSDITAPPVPTGLSATAANSTQVNLTWNASVDPTVNGAVTSGIAGYKLYRGNILIATITGTSYSDTGLSPSTLYSYKIAAFDAASNPNTSIQSSAVSATTPTAPLPPVPAVLSQGSPTTALAAGTIRATLSVVTDVPASCKYGTVSNTAYTSMPNTFSTTGNTTHSTSISNLTDGSTYTYYIRCAAQQTLINTGDYIVSFSVSNPTVITTPSGGGGTTSSGGTTGGSGPSIGSFTPLVQQPSASSTLANGAVCIPTTVPSTLAPLPAISSGLSVGSRGTSVTTLQAFLVSKGYLTRDSITGYYGPLTSAAVTKYKAALLPRVVACPTTPVAGATGPSRLAPGFQFTATLIPFATNPQVKSMQIFLNDHGYTVATTGSGSKGNETTYFGNATKAALIKFQKANNISPAIGNWGPLTRAKVNSLIK